MFKKLLSIALPVLMALSFAVPAAAASVTTTSEITVECPDAGGQFVIKPVGSAPKPSTDTLQVDNKGKGSFFIQFDQPDNYTYTVEQLEGAVDGVTYDKSVYEVTVHVLYNEKEEMYTELTVRKQGSSTKSKGVIFQNKTQKKHTTGGGGSGRKGGRSNVQTGDTAEIGFWASLCAGSGLILLILVILKIREDFREKRIAA